MSILCVIPARYGSTRLEGKPLIDLGGKTLIRRVYEAVFSAGCFDEVIVATDDDRILRHVMDFGGKAEMTSESHNSGTDRCAEVASRHTAFDFVVNVQGDEPLIEYDLLERVRQVLESGSHRGIVTAVTQANEKDNTDPNRVKVVLNHEDYALYFSRAAIPYKRKVIESVTSWRHLGLYAFDSELLSQLVKLPQSDLEKTEGLEQLRWLSNGASIKCIKGNWSGFGIDSPADVDEYIELLSK